MCDVSPDPTRREAEDDHETPLGIPVPLSAAPGLPVGPRYTWDDGVDRDTGPGFGCNPTEEEEEAIGDQVAKVAELRRLLLQYSSGYRHLRTDPFGGATSSRGESRPEGGGCACPGDLQGCSAASNSTAQGGGVTFRDLFCNTTQCARGGGYYSSSCGRGGGGAGDGLLGKEVFVVPAGDYAKGTRGSLALKEQESQNRKKEEECFDGDDVKASEMYIVYTDPSGRSSWRPAYGGS